MLSGKVKMVKIPLRTCTSLYGPFSVYNADTGDVYDDVELLSFVESKIEYPIG